jgi:hypothetical protein
MRRILGTPVIDYLPALGLLIVTALYLAAAYGYKPTVRAFPAGVAWIMVVLLALDLASRTDTGAGRALAGWLNPASSRHAAEAESAYPLARQVAAVLWVAAFAAMLVLLGILCAVPLYVFAALRFRGERRYRTCVLGAAGATVFIWLLFSVLLRLSLYPGLVFGGA